MPRVSNVTHFRGAPYRVWSALTEPSQRKIWHPYISVGDPRAARRSHCVLFLARWMKPLRVAAYFREREPGRLLRWTCGTSFVFSLEERYELSGDDGGTRMVHRLRFRGALAWMIPFFIYDRIEHSITQADRRLAQYLWWRATRLSGHPSPVDGLHFSMGEVQ